MNMHTASEQLIYLHGIP